jgi:linoleoyl-CoA desaturase
MIDVEQIDRTGAAEPIVRKLRPVPPKFGARDDFHQELRRRIDFYFESSGRKRRDCPRMYGKTALILAWCAASYLLLLWGAGTLWLALPAAASLGLAMAAIGFNVQHDGGHQAYSDRRWVNELTARSLDLLGGSSYIWARKHNVAHHSYTNLAGHDDDLDVGLLGRLSPHQPRHGFHRFQHLYLWMLYGLLPVKWQLYDDFRDVVTGRCCGQPLARPRGTDLAVFVCGKLAFFTLAFAVPLLLHPLGTVLLCYATAGFVQGVVLSVVFQLAHCVEEATFPLPDAETGRMENAWAVHQIETTVNFARRSRMVSWFVGGLNFQIEHHLFPRICHIHYPAIAPLVEQACREFGVHYRAHATLGAGVASHFRWLRRMGSKGSC